MGNLMSQAQMMRKIQSTPIACADCTRPFTRRSPIQKRCPACQEVLDTKRRKERRPVKPRTRPFDRTIPWKEFLDGALARIRAGGVRSLAEAWRATREDALERSIVPIPTQCAFTFHFKSHPELPRPGTDKLIPAPDTAVETAAKAADRRAAKRDAATLPPAPAAQALPPLPPPAQPATVLAEWPAAAPAVTLPPTTPLGLVAYESIELEAEMVRRAIARTDAAILTAQRQIVAMIAHNVRRQIELARTMILIAARRQS